MGTCFYTLWHSNVAYFLFRTEVKPIDITMKSEMLWKIFWYRFRKYIGVFCHIAKWNSEFWRILETSDFCCFCHFYIIYRNYKVLKMLILQSLQAQYSWIYILWKTFVIFLFQTAKFHFVSSFYSGYTPRSGVFVFFSVIPRTFACQYLSIHSLSVSKSPSEALLICPNWSFRQLKVPFLLYI